MQEGSFQCSHDLYHGLFCEFSRNMSVIVQLGIWRIIMNYQLSVGKLTESTVTYFMSCRQQPRT